MKVIKLFLIIILAVIVLGLLFGAYMGLFSKIKIVEKEMGPFTYVYESHVGPYKEAEAVFNKIKKDLNTAGVSSQLGIGIYYNDPRTVTPDKLSYDCGHILEAKDLAKVEQLKKNFKVRTMPKKLCVVAEFPIKNRLSYALGPMKCYKALSKYIYLKKYKIEAAPFELYDNLKSEKIFFVFQVFK